MYLDKLRLQEWILNVPCRGKESEGKYNKFVFPRKFEGVGRVPKTGFRVRMRLLSDLEIEIPDDE